MKKRFLLCILILLALSSNCYWPTNVESIYEPKVALNGLLIAGRPLDSLWITKTRSLDEAYDSTAEIVDTNRSVLLLFEGKDLASANSVDTLRPVQFEELIPHDCFFGQDTIRPNTWYSIEARIVLVNGDSATLRASTLVPDTVVIDSQKVPMFASRRAMQAMHAQGGIPKLAQRMMGYNGPEDPFVHALDGDTVQYLAGDSLLSLPYFFYPRTPVAGAAGIMMEVTWEDSLWIIDTTSILRRDTVRYPRANRERTGTVPQDSIFSSIFYFNGGLMMTGWHTFKVFACDSAFSKYEFYAPPQPNPYTNVEGGYGYFGSATVDSVRYFVTAPEDLWILELTDSVKAHLDSIAEVRDSVMEANSE